MIAIALTSSACSGDADNGATDKPGTSTQAEEIGDAAEGEISRSEPGTLRVTVGGDLTIEYEQEIALRIVVIRHPEVTAVRFLSVGIEQLQDLEDGTAFRVAFDLAGVFDGKGSYELPAVGTSVADPSDPGSAVAQGVSKPFLIYSPSGQPGDDPQAIAGVRSFENAIKACDVQVTEDDGGAGTVDCPELTDTRGNGRVSLHMEWATK